MPLSKSLMKEKYYKHITNSTALVEDASLSLYENTQLNKLELAQIELESAISVLKDYAEPIKGKIT